MAEAIRNYTPQRNTREELRARLEDAPLQHAEAVLAAYQLLQEAQDHGITDTLRGAIGAGDTIIGKAAEYANTPEGIRAMRNFLALSRLFGNLNPAKLDAVAKALEENQCRGDAEDCDPPSLWQTLRRLYSRNSRRTLATVAAVSEAFGQAQASSTDGPSVGSGARSTSSSTALPILGLALVAFASYWIGRRS